MKKYMEYMDSVRASDTLHQRLVGLEAAGKRPVPWKKYGAMAAALALVVGAGAWGMAHGGWNALAGRFQPSSRPEIAELEGPDIAIAEPGDVTEPGMKTIGGYEVQQGEMTSYFMLPGIDYGMSDGMAQMSLDWDVPPGSVKRELTQADFAALFGGEDALSAHLGWGGYEITGWAAWKEDGSFWGAFINGYKDSLDHFELAFTAGDVLPPTCIAYGEDGVVNQLWDVPVTAWGHDGRDGCGRRVEFLHDGYGFRFDLTGTDAGQAEVLVSRAARLIIVDGLAADSISPDGAVLAHPWEADPNYSVGEPNWNDSVPDQDTSGKESPRDRGENWCGTQGTDTETCPDCGAAYPVGSEHDCAMCDGYPIAHVCEVCGETYPEGTAHSHEACGYPLAPDTETCPDCGVTYPAGEAHYHTHTCEVCGQALPAGAEHSHQEEHHQEQHSGHH